MRQNLDVSKTLFALSSGSLPSAVAIERLSGPEAFPIAARLFQPVGGGPFLRERGMRLGRLVDAAGSEIDQVLALTFVGPHSFTGEDVVEFHCHGSLPIIRKLEATLLELGASPASRGEFSYRAHLNGKLSADDIERLGDVFVARRITDLQKIYSRRDGSLAQTISVLRAQLIQMLAIFDTAVDFSEEYSSVVFLALEPLNSVLAGCSKVIHRYSGFREGGTSRKLVLAGRPNAGKSSLFNGLLCRYRAIVHAEPGTTRDVIEEDFEVDGGLWKLVDTAGFRHSEIEAERQGIELGSDFLESSHFWILVVDGTIGLSDQERELLRRFDHKPHAVVWNKRDLPGWLAPETKTATFEMSAVEGDSFGLLWDFLRVELAKLAIDDSGPLPSAVQVARLKGVVGDLEEIRTKMQSEVPPEYLSEQTRVVIGKLESVVGEVGTEDVLDRIFNDFCIGK